MKLNGKFDRLQYNDKAERQLVFTVSTDCKNFLDEIKGKPITVDITVARQNRSKTANAYMWELCTLISEKLRSETKETIYQRAVREVGIYRDIELKEEAVNTIKIVWSEHGTGWFTELIDYGQKSESQIIRLYYGTSVYNSKQMSRIIDYIEQDAQSVGIDTISEQEKSLLLQNIN